MGYTSSSGVQDSVGVDVHVPTALVRELASAARILLAGVEPELIPLPNATALMDAFADLERIASAGRLLVSARATVAGEWKRSGHASAEEWLATRQGVSKGRARDDLKASERLRGLDDTTEALKRGDLSAEQAGTIADAATINPNAERDLLDRAQEDSLAGLREEAARRKAEREDQTRKHERIRKERFCRTWTDRDGAWNLRARGPIADVAGFNAELERLIDRRFRAHRADAVEQREGRDQLAFDTLVGLGLTGTSAGAGPPTPQTKRRSTPAPRHLALIRVDLTALVRGHVEIGEVCEIAGYGPVPVDEARRLLGDSLLKLVLTDGVDVVNVTHAGRGPRIAQEVALLWQHQKCCVAGCDRTRRLEFDHVTPYAQVQVTELGNTKRPCGHHHDLKTYEKWDYSTETATDGRTHLVPPDDPRHPRFRRTHRHGHEPPTSTTEAEPPSLFDTG